MEPYAMDSQKLPNFHKIVTNFAEFYNKIMCVTQNLNLKQGSQTQNNIQATLRK